MSRHGRNEEETIEGLRVQLEQVTAELVAALAQLDRIGAASGMPVAADGTGPIARVQGHRATGHRAPRDRGHLWVVPPLVIAACAALKAAWVAHPAAVAAAGAGSAVILTAAIAVVPGTARAHEHGPGVLAPNPAASIYSATPIPDPTSPSFAAFTRPRLDARSSASQPAAAAPWCCYAPPPPSSSPAAVPQPSAPASSPSPVSGIIQAVSSTVTVTDPTQDVQIPISATGGDTVWHAWVRGPDAADVTLTPAQGDLADGAAGYVDLAIDASAQATGGTVTVHIWPGDVMVVVTWLAVPVPVPSVVPSVVVTVAPTDSPSPAAS